MTSRAMRIGAVLITAVALSAGAWSTGAAQAGQRAADAPARFTALPPQRVQLDDAGLLSTSTKPTTVMLELAGKPVTVVDAEAPAPLSASRKRAVQAQLVQQQAAVRRDVQANGGKVLASYQLVYNGLRVTAPANRLASLAHLDGVTGVHRFVPKQPDNVNGVPAVGAPQVWGGASAPGPLHGEGIKLAIVDTGIDYTHADFGGLGTVEAYQAALATDTSDPDPTLVGPAAPRVKGGVDLVGDAYTGSNTPQPDSNPLDCHGHGTHVAGTAAGSGVLSDGTTFTGPYDSDTVSSHNWLVGPGVAPQADLYSIRVFGCTGSTNVVVDALEWAATNGMDVVNMSLGAAFGGPDDPDSVATNNLANDGVIVVVSAGNNGPNPYLLGSPGSADGALTVGANDATPSFPGATVVLPGEASHTAIDANGVAVNGLTAPIKVLYSGTPHDAAHISLGCDPNEYTAAGVAGYIVVVKRGTCARVARAIFGEQAGAVAVVMVNNVDSLPPYEGPITSNPDTHVPYTVTIPFLGVRASLGTTYVAQDGGVASLYDTMLSNPGYESMASFSSSGPRNVDSALKPDVTAPGVSVFSAGMGTGTAPANLSGTSMAAPHTAGVAALVRQSHPGWHRAKYWKAAIVNTARADLVSNYRARVSGAGFVQALPAVATQTVALGDDGTASLSYGFRELSADYSATHKITLRNFTNRREVFTVGHTYDMGDPHSLGSPASVVVPARSTVSVPVTLNVSAADTAGSGAFHDVAGLVTFTPHGGANRGVALAVPYYFVPQTTSHVSVSLDAQQLSSEHAATATISNNGLGSGVADWYAWGLSDGRDAGASPDLKAVGASTYGSYILFGVSTFSRWSNAARDEVDIYVDVNGDTTDDYVVFAADYGLLTAGTADGRTAVAVIDLRVGSGWLANLAEAPMNSKTMVLPVPANLLCQSGSPCLSDGNPRLTYTAIAFGRDGSVDPSAGEATFNAYAPAISNGMYDVLNPGDTTTEDVSVNPAEWAQSPPRGLLIISPDNRGRVEAKRISVAAPGP